MWTAIAVALLAPVVWALLGTPPIPWLDPWVGGHAPAWLATPVPVSTTPFFATVLVGVLLGVGRAGAVTTHLSTLVHEFGHGLTAALLGGRIDRITLDRDGSGRAHFAFPGRHPVRRFSVSFAGYVSPGVFGVASAQVALAGYAAAWLAYIVVLLAVMLVLAVRSWWGALLAVLLGAGGWGLLALIAGGESDVPASLLVALVAGVLLGGGVRDAVGQWRQSRGAVSTDAASMAAQTGLPTRLFAGLHVAFAVALAGTGLMGPFLG
ncbi:MAG: M50 family metallopeptidase [Candidatus Nanopelagicales bacterium]